MKPAFTVAVALLCVNAALALPLLGGISSKLTNALTGKKNSGNKEVPAVTVAPDVTSSLNDTVAATTAVEKVEELQNQTWTTEADKQEATDVPATETTPSENAATEETTTAGAGEDNEDPISSAISKLSSLPVAQFLGL